MVVDHLSSTRDRFVEKTVMDQRVWGFRSAGIFVPVSVTVVMLDSSDSSGS